MRIVLKTAGVLLLIIASNLTTFGQFNFEFTDEVIVRKGTDTLHNAWAGGLDYVQISSFDFDFDGDQDLFVFDRSQNNIRVFTQEIIGGVKKWVIVHDAYKKFPSDVIYRATMVDYDNDGRSDLFTYGIGGLKVYRNIGDNVNGIQWQLFKSIINSDYNGFTTNLYVASSDIPAIVDVDFDGDIDILTFHQGGQHVEYHKNMSMEMYGIPDSLVFVLKNECWGQFSENVNNNSVLLNDPNAPCNGLGSVPSPEKSSSKHAGSTLLALDYNNSGVMDLILGDVSYSNLILLINGGTSPNTDSPMISFDNSFPSNSLPADLFLFPAAFYLDVDFDGKKDLIVGANAKNVSENETSIMFYKNTGTNANPNFQFQTKSFLQNTMVEHGKGSIPVLHDFNNDGLKDLFVANLYRYKNNTQKESTIAWYKNTGTASAPVFTFIDHDFLNLSQKGFGLRLVPTFGDINGDGNEELIIGTEFGKLILFDYNGSTFVNPQQNYADNNGNPISSGSFAFPQLFDLNNDGLLDLVIGNKTGEITYYKNIGTSTAPSFKFITSNLGGIDVSTQSPDGYSAPHFFRTNDTTYLFLGDFSGRFHYYNNIDDSLLTGGNFNEFSNNFLDVNVEAYSSFFVDDIDNDGYLNLFIGQDLGGLTQMEVDPNSSSSITELNQLFATVYPNPSTNSITIQVETSAKISATIIDINGKQILTDVFSEKIQIDMSFFNKGVYFLQLISDDGISTTKKIIKL